MHTRRSYRLETESDRIAAETGDDDKWGYFFEMVTVVAPKDEGRGLLRPVCATWQSCIMVSSPDMELRGI